MSIAHLDEIAKREMHVGHIRAHWSDPGTAAGSERVGVRRLEVAEGHWSTPCHEHNAEEEIFYVLAGRGLAWQKGRTCEVRAGDCVVFRAGRGAHSMHAIGGTLDLLAFGPRYDDDGIGFPRLGRSYVGNRFVHSEDGRKDGYPIQFVEEAALGPPPLGDGPGERFASVVNLDEAEGSTLTRELVQRTWRDLAGPAGSVTTGLRHCTVPAGKEATPLHCHSKEDELFVVVSGDGVVQLGDDDHPIRTGSVIARPAGTGVAHVIRAGDAGIAFLAYGTREPNDICFYPRSKKLLIGGLGVTWFVEPVDYWDGEPD